MRDRAGLPVERQADLRVGRFQFVAEQVVVMVRSLTAIEQSGSDLVQALHGLAVRFAVRFVESER